MTKPSIFYINKAKIVLFPIKSVRSVRINAAIKCGSCYETKKNNGIFHFLEHMMLQGTKHFPSSEKISEFAKENGINYNAFTSGEKINIPLNIPDINLDSGLKMLDEIVFNPLIPPEKIKNELGVINQEILSYWDDPMNRFYKKVYEHLFGKNHIYNNQTLGQINILEKISSSDLKKLHKKYFQPQNMVITITGNINNTSDLIKKLTIILNKYKNTYKSKINYSPIKPSSQKTLIHQDKPNQETINLSWVLEKNKKNNRLQKISNNLFSNIFGNGFDSLLFKTFRLKYGLVYNIWSSAYSFKNYSIFEISCQIDPANSQKFLKILQSELVNIINQIDKKLFNRTKKYLDYRTLTNYDSIYDISDMINNESFKYKKIYLPEDYNNLANKIDFQKTINYFKEKIKWEDKYLFIMTPIKPEN